VREIETAAVGLVAERLDLTSAAQTLSQQFVF
jgi:hypothetical protein